ncbi:hypothetical protein [Cellulomonas sp. URHB0016]
MTIPLLTFSQATEARPRLELAFAEQTTTIDAAGRRIRGTVVPYGVPSAPTRNGRRYRFSGPPTNVDELVDVVREHDEDAVVGRLEAWEPTEGGLAASVRAFTTTAGNDALVEASEQVRTGFSVGAEALEATLGDDGVYDVNEWLARHVGLVRRPAFAGSKFSSIAASEAEPEQPEEDTDEDEDDEPAPPKPAAPPVELSRRPRRASQLTFARARDELANAIRRSPDAAFVNAALSDIVPAADAGAGFLRPQWLDELWTPVAVRRDYIESINRQALTTGTRVYGWRWVTYPEVDDYAGNKTAIPSNLAATEPAEAPISRLAGGWDVDRIYVDLGDPGFLEAFFQAATRDYAMKTEAKVSAALQAEATDATATDLVGALGVIATSLSAVGATPSFIGVASDLWGDFLTITADAAPFWLASSTSVSLSGSEGTVSGMRFFVDPSLPAGHILGGDRNAATYFEASPAPLRVQAVNIPNGGIDIAVFGYQAVLVNDPRALVDVTVGPVLPLAEAAPGRNAKAAAGK